MIEFVDIKGFKIFNSLKINNLKQVNLIGGKNNIGKTAFLEAMELFVSSSKIYDTIIAITKLILKRQNQNRVDLSNIEFDIINYDSNSCKIKIDQKELIIKLIEPDFNQNFTISIDNTQIVPEKIIEITLNNETKKIPFSKILNLNLLSSQDYTLKQKVNFISSSAIDESSIAIFYGELIDLGKEDFLDNSLKLFDDNFIALKQKTTKQGTILKLKLKNRDKPILLSSLGEGINRFIAIYCAIWASKDGYLFIDEIENGIHYTNYKNLWDLIFQVSTKANCQVFATTHSKECIDSFNKANQNNGIYIELYKNKKNEIIAKQRDKEQLTYSLTHNGSFRGE